MDLSGTVFPRWIGNANTCQSLRGTIALTRAINMLMHRFPTRPKLQTALFALLGRGTVLARPYFLAPLASHAAQVLKALWLNHSLVVMRVMHAAFHYLKILRSVVVTYTVNVMNNLVIGDRAISGQTRNVYMLADIAALICIRVVWFAQKYVAVCGDVLTAIPSWIRFFGPRALRSAHTWCRDCST